MFTRLSRKIGALSLIPVTTALTVVYVGDRDALMEDSSR